MLSKPFSIENLPKIRTTTKQKSGIIEIGNITADKDDRRAYIWRKPTKNKGNEGRCYSITSPKTRTNFRLQ